MFNTSHPELDCGYLIDYPIEDRYLKVPIQNLLSVMGITLNRPQLWLVNAINSNKLRFITCNYSRRLGKTYVSNLILFCKSLEPDQNLIVVAPDYNLATISFQLQQKFLKAYELETTRLNQKDRVIEYTNGTIVTIGSESRMDTLSGYTRNLCVQDENALCSATYMSKHEQTLRPSFDADLNSKMITISTPRGMNHFREFYDRGHNPEFTFWASAEADVDENPRASKADIEEARKTMTRALFLQEYYVNWTVRQGTIYELDDECILDHEVIPIGPKRNYVSLLPKSVASADEIDSIEEIIFEEIICGIDPGYRDPWATIVLGITSNAVYVIDEYLSNEKVTSVHADKLHSFIDKYNIDIVYVDSANAQTRADLAYDYDIPTNKARKDVLEGIGYCQSLIEHKRVFVLRKCKHTIDMFRNYVWAPSVTADGESLTKEKPLHNDYSHIADAFRYSVFSYKYNLDAILEQEAPLLEVAYLPEEASLEFSE